MPNHDGSLIITGQQLENRDHTITTWYFEDGVYVPQASPALDIKTMRTISPDGQYIQGDGEIWHLPDWTRLGDVPFTGLFTPNNHFIAFPQNSLQIYDANSTDLLREIDLNEVLGFDPRQFFLEDKRLVGISPAGDWAALIIGTHAALIPIGD